MTHAEMMVEIKALVRVAMATGDCDGDPWQLADAVITLWTQMFPGAPEINEDDVFEAVQFTNSEA